MQNQWNKSEYERVEQILEQLATNYATDANGVFNLPDYVAFKDGVRAGLAAKMMLDNNASVDVKGSDN